MISFNSNLLNIWKRSDLMLFALLDISIRSTLLLGRGGSCFFTHGLLLLKSLLGFQLGKELWVLVLPVANCPGNGDDSLNATIIDKTTTSFDPLHFSRIIRLVIVTELRYFSCFIYKDCP